MSNHTPLMRDFIQFGRSEECPVIDMHAHFGPFRGIYFPTTAPEAMLRSMDTCGVERIVFSAHLALVDPLRGNEFAAQLVQQYPDRFAGYWVVNPNYPDIIERDLETFASRSGFIGFKLHPDTHKYPITGEGYRSAFAYADKHHLPVLTHTWGRSSYSGPDQLRQVVKAYPGITWIMGHAFYGQWEAGAQLAQDYDNVYLELCAAYAIGGVIEFLVQEVGSQRILYGTDLPWFSPHSCIGCVLFAHISDDDRRNILYQNAAGILARVVS